MKIISICLFCAILTGCNGFTKWRYEQGHKAGVAMFKNHKNGEKIGQNPYMTGYAIGYTEEITNNCMEMKNSCMEVANALILHKLGAH